MKKENKLFIIGVIGLAVALLAGKSQTLRAEATRQIYGDGGIYTGVPDGSWPIFVSTWAAPTRVFTFNPQNPADPNVPEGKTAFTASLTLAWGGWGIFHDTAWGAYQKIGRNYTGYTHLRFWMKSNRVTLNSSNPDPLTWQYAMKVEIEYFNTSGVINKIPLWFPVSTANVWQEYVFPLSLLPPGFNITRVTSPFLITAANCPASIAWSIDDVRWTKPLQSVVVFPAAVQVNSGRKRQFTIEGRSGAGGTGELVMVYGRFNAPTSLGTMNPATPVYALGSILTANASNGAVTATAVIDPMTPTTTSGNSAVTVTTANLDEKYGLLSETIPGVTLDTDAYLQRITGPGTTDPLFATVSAGDAPEQNDFFRITVNQTRDETPTQTGHFSGWAVRWGMETTIDDTITKNMSRYYEGSLRFWFRGPSAFRDKLFVGCRSGNVPSGKEASKLNLADYVAFDGNWHPVVIPIAHLAKQRPFADLSRMKYFFTIIAVGNVGGLQSFDIDNVRWDTQMPGTMTSLVLEPSTVLVPINGKRAFYGYGRDAQGRTIDVSPTWDMPDGALGTVNTTVGPSVILTARSTPFTGRLRATAGGFTAISNVNVAVINYAQFFNVYSDLGSGGSVGVSTGPADQTATEIGLREVSGGAPEGAYFRRSTYTLDNFVKPDTTVNHAWAVWFTTHSFGPDYLHYYANGYLRFFVRTTRDLQFSISSRNIPPGTELSKMRLSKLGIPLNGEWQEIIVSLADFKVLEPRLNFDIISNYFTIGALADQVGEVTDGTFDVDDVKWLTADTATPDVGKVYQGLIDKQQATGLVQSYERDTHAYTYDQALAAMAYTYHKDYARAAAVFDAYKNRLYTAAGFDGFYDAYHMTTYGIWDGNRLAGPNAWMMLALIHYKNATGSTAYDGMLASLAAWLRSLQDVDGAVRYGRPVNTALINLKSTEHNMDVYAAFKAYAQSVPTAGAYNTYAAQVMNWLRTRAWNTADAGGARFNVGTHSDGVTMNTDKALDVYSWAPLALSSFTTVLPLAERDFLTTKNSVLTGLAVTGFDFSGPIGQPIDKDAVWLEGTAQMSLAFLSVGNVAKADTYRDQVMRAIFPITENSQGLAYATNNGTAYGFTMGSSSAAVSSDAWFLFAYRRFNPFRVAPLFSAQAKNISNNLPSANYKVNWSTTPGVGWVLAAQYIQLEAQGITIDSWGMEIYTHNTDNTQPFYFADPTPEVTFNLDSDPAGLLYAHPEPTPEPTPGPTPPPQRDQRLPVGWTIKPNTQRIGTDLLPADPETGPITGIGNRYQWFRMLDLHTPPLDTTGDGTPDTTGFIDGMEYVRIWDPRGLHVVQGPAPEQPPGSDYSPVPGGPAYIYLQADFRTAAAQTKYQTKFYINYYME